MSDEYSYRNSRYPDRKEYRGGYRGRGGYRKPEYSQYRGRGAFNRDRNYRRDSYDPRDERYQDRERPDERRHSDRDRTPERRYSEIDSRDETWRERDARLDEKRFREDERRPERRREESPGRADSRRAEEPRDRPDKDEPKPRDRMDRKQPETKPAYTNPWVSILKLGEGRTAGRAEASYKDVAKANGDITRLQEERVRLSNAVALLDVYAARDALNVDICSQKLDEFSYL